MIPPRPRSVPLPAPISLSKLLLVEGDTPLHFFEALLLQMNLSGQIEIRNFRGVDELPAALAAIASLPQFSVVQSIGIVRDAELDARAAFDAANHALSAPHFIGRLPAGLKTSVFILPDNQRAGMLETLLVDSIGAEPSYACLEEFFNCTAQQGAPLPAGEVRAKSLVQAYLATRPDVQMFPGIAAYRGYWPWDSPAFDPLKQFLRDL